MTILGRQFLVARLAFVPPPRLTAPFACLRFQDVARSLVAIEARNAQAFDPFFGEGLLPEHQLFFGERVISTRIIHGNKAAVYGVQDFCLGLRQPPIRFARRKIVRHESAFFGSRAALSFGILLPFGILLRIPAGLMNNVRDVMSSMLNMMGAGMSVGGKLMAAPSVGNLDGCRSGSPCDTCTFKRLPNFALRTTEFGGNGACRIFLRIQGNAFLLKNGWLLKCLSHRRTPFLRLCTSPITPG